MVTSSVNAPMKKDGYGGAYNWGGPMDVKDFEPHAVQQPKVIVMSAPVQMAPQVISAQPATFAIDSSQFPSLGSVRTVAAQVAWGPHAMQTMPAQMHTVHPQIAPQSIRIEPGSFDAQHPRNAFARFPRVSHTTVVQQDPQLAVDWSGAGTSNVTQVIYQHAAGTAHPTHLGPLVHQHASVPLAVLREAGPPASQRMCVPRLQQHYTYTTRPPVIQPQSRSARRN